MENPLFFRDADVARLLDWRELVETLRTTFRDGQMTAPLRGHYRVGAPGEADGILLTMPAWIEGQRLGVKIATVFPDAGRHGQPVVAARYLLMDARSGRLLAHLEAAELTARRTAAASVLAAEHLARPDARTLLIVGAGRLARRFAAAYVACRPAIQTVEIWARRTPAASALAAELAELPVAVSAVADLEPAVRRADIVSAVTLSETPLIQGGWLRSGVHLDLAGGFRPSMREADDEAVRRARVFCDTSAALEEAGDLLQPITAGVLSSTDVTALGDLCAGRSPGRRGSEEVTLFKSVGCAEEDLAAAGLTYDSQKKVRTASTTS